MNDFGAQLLKLAEMVQETIPQPSQDPQTWMHRAGDLADACIVDGRLARELAPIIPLSQHGDFVRAADVLKGAAGAYTSERRYVFENALALIVKVPRREKGIENDGPFSIQALQKRAERFTTLQKQILDATWNRYRETGQPLPVRSIQPLIGKQALKDVLKGLNGSLITETQEDNARCLAITIYGALVTGHGNGIASLLVGSLDLVKQLYVDDNFIKQFDSAKFEEKFGKENTKLFFRLLKMQIPHRFPFQYAGGASDGSNWTVRIGDEVMDLYQADDTAAYLDELMAARYNEQEPMMYDDRLKRDMSVNANAFAELQHPWRIDDTPSALRAIPPSYIDPSRLDELRVIKSEKFDCTRLIVMCEELNACAARNNAHAVIMLTRAIVDHIPPVFGYKSFDQVAANYGGNRERSFKEAMERLDKHIKKVAHRLLHGQITDKEVAPTMGEVSYPGELNHLLTEVYRRLK